MKFKTILSSLFAAGLLFSAVSSYAMDVYLKNNTIHNITFFKLPNQVSFGPVNRYTTVKLPAYESWRVENQQGEVTFVTKDGAAYTCGTVAFVPNRTISITVTPTLTHFRCTITSVA